jgi:hypothetical protein
MRFRPIANRPFELIHPNGVPCRQFPVSRRIDGFEKARARDQGIRRQVVGSARRTCVEMLRQSGGLRRFGPIFRSSCTVFPKKM